MSNNDLLLAGWHGLYTGGKQFWAHPNYDRLITYHQAMRILKQRGVDKDGFMRGHIS